MIDLAVVNSEFPEVRNLTIVGNPSGQKEVLKGIYKSQPVALKLIKPWPTNRDVEYERVQREVFAAAKLQLDYIPTIYDQGEKNLAGNNRLYIIEQWIDGETYKSVLRQQPIQSIASVLHLADFLLQASVEFEKAKMIHRDIKPDNLIEGTDKKLWIIDFGLVRHLEMDTLTPLGVRGGMGTPGYASREEFRNEKPIDIRADLFSIGMVLYESLNGSNPYLTNARDMLAVFRKMENEDLTQLIIPGDSDGKLSEFIKALTGRYASRRPQTAKEALEWFNDVKANITT